MMADIEPVSLTLRRDDKGIKPFKWHGWVIKPTTEWDAQAVNNLRQRFELAQDFHLSTTGYENPSLAGSICELINNEVKRIRNEGNK